LQERRISANEFRVNETILVPEVRLIGATGDNVGVVATRDALRMAREADLDLVEVAPNSSPPVCRIMDFGKFLYEREKKEREARKTQTKVEVKEIRLRPKTTGHHRDFKVDDARRWLDHNMKVRVTIRFRGREITYPEIALEDLREIAQSLADVGIVEQAPSIEGRAMSMMLVPAKGGKKKVKEGADEISDKKSEQPRDQVPAKSDVKE
jgi:translation initiation factor IF-3